MAIRVVELTEAGSHHELTALYATVWGTDAATQLIDSGLLRALAYTGNYVAGAYVGAEMVGGTVAFHTENGGLHSHITGVLPNARGHGVGRALKLHQREWALRRNIGVIGWTFDPLVRRNAYFNLHGLGATATAYLPDFYGAMSDDVNAGAPTDRLAVEWRLASPRVEQACAGRADEPRRPAEAFLLVDRDGDEPVAAQHRWADGAVVLVAVPPDIESLRARAPATAMLWRTLVREALVSTVDNGYAITAMTRDGWYVLEATR
ncbi:putative GNAT superfamily acetyltransferase [Herbihabitans rhizosphaerae]|uniref:Putative GNAT superfamily acetyltransferase n=1 Tax=Herbihabitans rhizosphaerae TaxID=1872711 RepID=A0A4Q7L2T7_9PSEU|nr:GNAT family N-acetyltransferase [Herbihabitans rhizosphaerae]RZS43436.1 putative GNAT superfamily acetyltransferase [Herbihabitans rhizosphaerae]